MHSDHIYQSVRNRDDTCFVVKQAGSLIWFPRGFPRVALENSAGSLRCHVVGSGFFGETLLVLARGFPRVASVMLRLWHGPGPHRWLVFKARVQRTGVRWRVQLRKREA